MKNLLASLIALVLLVPVLASAQQEEKYDYWRFNRDMIRYGQQAIMMCNGLFTSHRTLEQVFDRELAYIRQPVGTARGGDYVIDKQRRAVAIGTPGATPTMRAVSERGSAASSWRRTRRSRTLTACRSSTCRHHQATRPARRGPMGTSSSTREGSPVWIPLHCRQPPTGRSIVNRPNR